MRPRDVVGVRHQLTCMGLRFNWQGENGQGRGRRGGRGRGEGRGSERSQAGLRGSSWGGRCTEFGEDVWEECARTCERKESSFIRHPVLTCSVFIVVAEVKTYCPAELQHIAPLVFVYHFIFRLLKRRRAIWLMTQTSGVVSASV